MQINSLIFLIFFSTVSTAGELQYFESKIDYWGDKKEVHSRSSAVPSIIKKSESKSDGKFPWKTYLDPKNKEFFKEGDYTPPEPFMEIARDPSDDNIKNWFEFMKKKNELAKRLEDRMQEYLAKSDGIKMDAFKVEKEVPRSMPAVQFDLSRFKIRMYFESTCPHCRRMFGVLKQLQDKGVQIEALQVDSGHVSEHEKVVPIGMADPTEMKKHQVKGVPFLLIADNKRKAILPPVEGYHGLEEVLSLLRAASQN